MILRDPTAADLPAIDYVYRSSFCDTFAHLYDPENLAMFLAGFTPEAWAAEFVDDRYAFQVAEVRGEVVGYVKLGPVKLPVANAAGSIELSQFYILKQHHGAGIAPKLMDWLLAEARARAASAIFLSVFTENHRARRFYERYGFTYVGPYHFMVGNHADEDIIMKRAL